MTDVFDRATEREEQQREAALAEARYRREQERARPAEKRCRVCEALIPVARRRAVPGVQTCIDCQRDIEHATASGGD